MEVNKYIIKNCTSLDSDGTTCQDCTYKNCGADDCINRTDCVIKQVVEKLRKTDNSCYKIDCAECSEFYMSHSKLANDILKLFDI